MSVAAIPSLLEELSTVCTDLGYTLEEFLLEKLGEAMGRRHLRLVPADHLTEAEVRNYLVSLLGRNPSPSELRAASGDVRKRRLSERERIEVERRQYDRCGNCGRFLDRDAEPHVDHIVPIAFGGLDELENLQLLCGKCNLGKGSLVSWHLGVPWAESRMTARLRYCVIARANGKCQERDCVQMRSTTELVPGFRIARSTGGRFQFDNLLARCQEHSAEVVVARHKTTLSALKAARSPDQRIASMRR